MCLGGGSTTSNAGVTITDPLASQKAEAANLSLQQYKNELPYANQWLSTFMPNMGNYNWNQPGKTPQSVVNADTTLNSMLSGSQGGGLSDAFSGLKQNLLGYSDTQNTANNQALQQQLQSEGLMGSGPGLNVMQNAGNQYSQQRSLLGSEADTNLYNMQNNLAQTVGNLGFQEAGLGTQYGVTDPLKAWTAALALSAPQFQNILTTPNQDNSQGLGQLLGMGGGNILSSLFGGGTKTTAPAGATASTGNLGSLGGINLGNILGMQTAGLGTTNLQNGPTGGQLMQLMQLFPQMFGAGAGAAGGADILSTIGEDAAVAAL